MDTRQADRFGRGRGRRTALSAALLAGTLLLAGCGEDPDAVYAPATASLSVSPLTYQSSSEGYQPFALGTFSDVASIQIEVVGPDVYGVAQNPLTVVALSQGPSGAWQGTIPNLPAGPALDFTARAYNASGTLLFSGVTQQVVTTSQNAVFIALQPVAGSTPFGFPRVVSIAYAAAIQTNAQARIALQVQGTPGETLSYELLPAPFGGSFIPLSGTVTLPGGSSTANVIVAYTAPARDATFRHAVRITNSQNNSVETEFRTTTVEPGGGGVALEAPVITGISGVRDGSTVTWTATVTDDQPLSALSYAWSFTQTAGPLGVGFTTADANPGVLSGYDLSVAGTATLLVTDGDDLSASVSFELVAGQLPGSVIFRPPVAVDDIVQMTVDAPLTIDLLANDSDPDGDPITIVSITGAARGTVTDHGDGTVTFVREPGFNGQDGFTYTISDGYGGTATATATILIALNFNVGSDTEIGVGTSVGSGTNVGANTTVGSYTTVGSNTTISQDVTIGDEVTVGSGVFMDESVVVGNGASVSNNVTLAEGAQIGENVSIDSGTYVAPNAAVGAGSQVQQNVTISANVVVGESVTISSGAGLGESVTVGDGASIGGNVWISEGSVIGPSVTIAAGSGTGEGVVIGTNVQIAGNVWISESVEVGNDVTIGQGTGFGEGVIIGTNVQIGNNVWIGNESQIGDNVVIGNNVSTGSEVTILAGAVIPDGTWIPGGSTVP